MQTELNVSLLRGRRILDHRALRAGMSLRVPREERGGFELAATGKAEEGEILLDFRAGEPFVRLPAGVAAKVGVHGEFREVSAGEVMLPSGARGWIDLGPATLLIQSGPRPAPAPKRRLPPQARVLISRAERPLLAVLATALVLEVLFVNAVRLRKPIPLEAEPEEDHSPAIPVRLTQPVVPKVVTEAPRPAPRPAPAVRSPGAPAPHKIEHEVGRAPLIMALQSLGDHGLFSRETPVDLTQAFKAVHGGERVSEGMAAHRGTEIAAPVGIGTIETGDNGQRRALEEHNHPRPTLAFEPTPIDPDPVLDPDDVTGVARQIKSRIGEIQGCYEASLKLTPGLGGRMVIQFDVRQDGRIEDVSYPGDQLAGDKVQQCIVLHAKAWRLRPLRAADGISVAFPFVFSAHEL